MGYTDNTGQVFNGSWVSLSDPLQALALAASNSLFQILISLCIFQKIRSQSCRLLLQ
jgi:hypothetical protein